MNTEKRRIKMYVAKQIIEGFIIQINGGNCNDEMATIILDKISKLPVNRTILDETKIENVLTEFSARQTNESIRGMIELLLLEFVQYGQDDEKLEAIREVPEIETPAPKVQEDFVTVRKTAALTKPFKAWNDDAYNRAVKSNNGGSSIFSEPVQPLYGFQRIHGRKAITNPRRTAANKFRFPTLKELTMKFLMVNPSRIGHLRGQEEIFDLIEPALLTANLRILREFELKNPEFLFQTDVLWERHYNSKFRKEPSEFEIDEYGWRAIFRAEESFYERKLEAYVQKCSDEDKVCSTYHFRTSQIIGKEWIPFPEVTKEGRKRGHPFNRRQPSEASAAAAAAASTSAAPTTAFEDLDDELNNDDDNEHPEEGGDRKKLKKKNFLQELNYENQNS